MFPQVIELVSSFLDPESLLNLRSASQASKEAVDRHLSNRTYTSTPMLIQYRTSDPLNGVKYFLEDERDALRISVNEGRFYLGESLFTSGDLSAPSPMGKRAHLYAISTTGCIYVFTKAEKINHSSMLAGANVICAGFVCVENGVLQWLSNCSGHYQPSVEALFGAISVLLAGGVDINTYNIKYERPGRLFPKDMGSAAVFIDSVPVSLRILVRKQIAALTQ